VLLASIPHTGSLLGPVAPSGIAAFAIFVGLGYPKLKDEQKSVPFSKRLFYAHFVCIALVVLNNAAALHASPPSLSQTTRIGESCLVVAGIALLALACVPLHGWAGMSRTHASLLLLALGAGMAAWWLRHPFQSLWDSSSLAHGRILQIAAFYSVRKLLRLVLPEVISDPATFTLGTPRFLIYIAEECSGMEGLGLVLVFTFVWLWYFRKETRFPHAFLLVPCALACVWLLNIVRITAMILIGDAGAPEVAMVGFHSQAGWIAFTGVALAFSMASRKLSWLRMMPAEGQMRTARETIAEENGESPATIAYLVPFLVMLAASFVSKAVSGGFEWLYPLRFIAAVIALWHFRSEYRKLDWRFGWTAPVAGAVIFLVSIITWWWMHGHSADSRDTALAALSPMARVIWVAFRVAAAGITIPIVEELAFRGYLARRLINRNFDGVSFSSLKASSVILSSVAYGLMQGSHWISGILAGLAFAVILKQRGRIGDAIAAHATSNLLMVAWVLIRGGWRLS
jgi:exosortase E/protease (VPEID-CTERM system)